MKLLTMFTTAQINPGLLEICASKCISAALLSYAGLSLVSFTGFVPKLFSSQVKLNTAWATEQTYWI